MPDRKKVIIKNESLSRKIVYAINKAVTIDGPNMRREERLETNNRHIFAIGDCINENLRKHVVKDEVVLLPFSRYAWEGRILVDKENHITYTISTHQTLKNVINRNRTNPHYLHSILYAENGKCKGQMKQLSISDCYPNLCSSPFDDELLNDDYNKIMNGAIDMREDYIHYIVAYSADKNEISCIEMLLYDKDFSVVDKLDLLEYVNPDFATLTENEYNSFNNGNKDENEKKKVLLKLKPGVKPVLRSIENQA